MKRFKLDDMTRGWLMGDFEPAVLRTKDFEVCLTTHSKGQEWPVHTHKIATEYNVMICGKLSINGEVFEQDDIFVIEAGEMAEAKFLEDCRVLVIKVPSVIGDKYEAEA